MEYYIIRDDWDYDILVNEDGFEPYEEFLLNYGIQYDNLPNINIEVNNKNLPNSIPNVHQIPLFDNKIRDIISKYGCDLQYFDANLFAGKEMVSANYKTANVLKVIDAIDRDKSELTYNVEDEATKDDIADILDLRLNYNIINKEVLFRLRGFETLLIFRADLAQELVNERIKGIEFYKAEGFRL